MAVEDVLWTVAKADEDIGELLIVFPPTNMSARVKPNRSENSLAQPI